MKSLMNYGALLGMGWAALAFVGCSDGGEAGTEGEACYENGTCNEGLECRSDLCVAGPGGSPRSAGEIVEDCTSCGSSSCTAEAEACDGAEGCSDVLKCWVGCLGDQSCVEECDLTQISAANLAYVNEYFACTVTECISECAPDTGGSTGTGGGSGSGGGSSSGTGGDSTGPEGDPCSTEGEFDGSCVTSDFRQCVDGTWQSGSCEGCELVSPSGTCAYVTPATLRKVGADFVSEQPTDLDFVQTSELVQAEWYLEASEVGMLQFVFSSALSESKVKVLGASGDVDRITLETEDGSSGCQYTLESDGSLKRDAEYGYDDYFNPVLYWNGCWGLWESNVSLGAGPTTATILSIRSDEATSNELINLSVTRVLI